MVVWDFEDLLIIDVVLYGSALLLEFAALIALRRSQPGADRPFRIPFSRAGLIIMTMMPVTCLTVAVGAMALNHSIHTNALLFAVGGVVTAPFAWTWAKRM
jgi:amino acid transporter